MQFSDFRVENGNIAVHLRQDTGDLSQPALQLCGEMLQRLRAGDGWATHGQFPGLPEFWVRLDVDPILRDQMGERVGRPDAFFCVSARPRDYPFQINVVLPAGESRTGIQEADQMALWTLMGLSMTPFMEAETPGQAELDRMVQAERDLETILDSRPALVTCMMPTESVSSTAVDTIMIAANFSTCFAAAMLLETAAKQPGFQR